jgi:CheY-like chemotaxis protein
MLEVSFDSAPGPESLVLIVDDDPGSAELAATHLSRMGYGTAVAADGRSALATVLEKMPSAILLDLHLPDMSGFAVCGTLKQNPETRSIPVLILSSQHSREDVLKALQMGADDFLVKPLDPQVLLHKVSSLLLKDQPKEPAPGDPGIGPQAASNRRQYVRINYQAEGILRLPFQIMDISEGGVGVVSDTPLDRDATLEITSPLFEEVLNEKGVMAKARYCSYLKSQRQFRIGVEFMGMSEKHRRSIRQYIFRRQTSRVKPKEIASS